MHRAIVVALAVAMPGALAAQTAPTFAGAWMGGPLDSNYNAEYARVQAACRGLGDACYETELYTTAVRLAPVHAGPGTAEPVGWLATRLRPRGPYPYAALVYLGEDGDVTPLVEDLGDWGYGITLDLADSRAGWIRPWLLAPAGDLWLSTEGAPGFGVVEGPYGLEDRLWRMGPLRLAGGTADTDVLPEGNYMVLAVQDGTVCLRGRRTRMGRTLCRLVQRGAPAQQHRLRDAERSARRARRRHPRGATDRLRGRSRTPPRAMVTTRATVEPAYPKGG